MRKNIANPMKNTCPQKDNPAHPETIYSLFEKAGKIFAIGIMISYSLGLLITNFYLNMMIKSCDFNIVRARFVFTGILFFLYIMIPICLIGIPILLGFYFYNQYSNRSLINWIMACLASVLTFTTLFSIIPLGLHYFIPRIIFETSQQIFTSQLKGHLYICKLFWCMFLGFKIVGFVLLILILFYARKLYRNKKLTGSLAVGTLISVAFLILFQLFFFVRDVYPNIAEGVGGGNPRLVLIKLTNKQRQFDGMLKFQETSDEVTIPAIVMYSGNDYLHIVTIPNTRPDTIDMNSIALPLRDIQSFRSINGFIGIYPENGMLCWRIKFNLDKSKIWMVEPNIRISLLRSANDNRQPLIAEAALECTMLSTNSTLLFASSTNLSIVSHVDGHSTITGPLSFKANDEIYRLNIKELSKISSVFCIVLKDIVPDQITEITFTLYINGLNSIAYSSNSIYKAPNGSYFFIPGQSLVDEMKKRNGQSISNMVDKVRTSIVH